MSEFRITYTHEPENNHILAKNQNGEVIGEIEYSVADEYWNVSHTGVRPEYRGGDIALTLVRLIVEAAREAGVKLEATCPYAVKVLERTQEYQDVYSAQE